MAYKEIRDVRQRTGILILMGICMLWELAALVMPSISSAWGFGMHMAELVIIGRISGMIDLWKNRWLLIPWAALILVFLCSALRDSSVLSSTKKPLGRGLVVYGLCPAVGLILSEDGLKRFLRIFTGVWTIFFFVLTVTGIYCAFQGIAMIIPGRSNYIGIKGDVFRLMAQENTTGILLAMSIAVALTGCLLQKRRLPRILYLVSTLPMMLGIGMTRNRGGMIVASLSIALTATAILQPWLTRKLTGKGIRVLISILIVVVIAAPALLGINASRSLFNRYVTGEQRLFPSARAEETRETSGAETAETAAVNGVTAETDGAKEITADESLMAGAEGQLSETDAAEETNSPEPLIIRADEVVPIRDMNLLMKYSSFFSGRERGWQWAMQVLQQEPTLLLTGTSLPLVMDYVNGVTGGKLAHLHCMPLQILMETGIWGFGLMIAWLVLFIRGAWRLYFGENIPLWKRVIPIPAVTLMVIELIECVTRLGNSFAHAGMILMLFSGLTIALGQRDHQGQMPSNG